jgi:acyl carrier protein
MSPKEQVYDILDDHFAVTPENPTQTLSQLGFDSLDQVELLIQLEEATGRDFGVEHGVNGETTVRYLIDMVSGNFTDAT